MTCKGICGVALWAMLGAALWAGEIMAQVAGHTPGEFSVDPSGAATYRIPLQVPPGTAGMQPDLALLYHSRAGNGHIGVGWSLSGLSAITRCPALRDQAGVGYPGGVTLSSSDRFCLDGQPLRHQGGVYGGNGTRYATEIETFQEVTSNSGTAGVPGHFVVADRAGLKRYYGNTSDSRILSVGVTSGVPVTWALNRIEDRLGNAIDFSYGFDGTLGEYWLREIRWSNRNGVLLGRVEMNYSLDRPDKTLGHGFGRTRLSLTRRLESIATFDGAGTPVRRYNLGYLADTGGNGLAGSPLSYLYTVQECAGAGGECLAPTELLRDVGWRGVNSLNPQQVAGDFNTIYWMDVNGDGRPDGVVRNNGTLRIFFAADDGRVTQTSVPSGNHIAFQHAVVLDYNGDGLMDLLVANTNTGYWNLYRSTGSSFVLETTSHLHYGAHNRDPVAFDLSGNGIPELFFRHNGKLWYYRGNDAGGFVSGAVVTGLTVSNGQRFHPMEFTGDGRPELLIDMQGCSYVVDPDPDPCPECDPFSWPATPGEDDVIAPQDAFEPGIDAEITLGHLSNNHCSHSAAAYEWNHVAGHLGGVHHAGHLGFSKPRLLDVNGDGLTDIVALNPAGQVQLFLNRGGLLEAQWPAFPAGPAWDKAVVFDYNLDGRDDVLFPAANGNFQFFTYRNNIPAVGPTWISSTANGYQAADWNGDGLSDLLVRAGSQWRVWPHHGRKEGLLVRVRNGLGDELNIRYASLSRADDGYTLYQGHLDDGAPINSPRIRHFRGPVFVVENFAADSGVNSASGQPQPVVTQYRYAGAKLNVYGRGFLGFRRMTAHNLNTGIETVNEHAQDFPFTGMVTSMAQRTPDLTVLQPTDAVNCPPPPGECIGPRPVETTIPGQKILETENLLVQLTLGSGAGQVRFPYVQQATEQQFEFGASAPYRRTRTDYAYNTQGNATQVTVTTDNGSGADVHTTTTVNAWKHTAQCPSRLLQSVVTQVGPSVGGSGPLSRQRVAQFEYFDGNGEHCQLKSETSHFGASAALTTTYTYDSFGNRTSARVTGSGISPARTTTWGYDPQGRYLVQATNPAGHTESYTWHPGLGRRLTATDANGLTLSWQHDGFGRETLVTGPRTTQFTNTDYAWCGTTCQHPAAVLKVTRTDGGSGNQQSMAVTELDRLGREVAAGARNVQGQMVYTLSFFDAAGRLYASSGPYRPGLDTGACWTLRHFDPLGRVRAEYGSATQQHCTGLAPPAPGSTPAGWSHTRMTYSGLTTTVIDPEGRQRQTIVNVMERPRFVREHDGSAWRQTEYRYDGHGNTTWVQDPGGALTTSVFDTAGRKTSMSDPSMGSWSYAYNAAGELISQTDANGTTITMTYDLLGRIQTRTEPEGATTWTYDNTAAHGRARGRVTNIAGPHGYIERFWYHGAGGELSASARFIGDQWFWTHIDHDSLGQVSQLRYPSVNCAVPCGLVPPDASRLRVDQHYRYGQLFQVRERRPDGTSGAIYWEALEVDALGAVTRERLGNGLFTQRYVNPATGMVESIYTGTAGDPISIQDLAMEWDRVGNLTQRADHRSGVNRREDLGYDGLGRLTGVTLRTTTGGLLGTETAQYGPSGNILRKGSYTNYQFVHPGRPHRVSSVTTPSGTRSYSYDPNGNLIQVTGPGARTVTWWSFNKPRRLESDSNNHSEYWYGPGGDRALFRQSARINGQLEVTWYGSALYERRHVGAAVEHTHYIQAKGGTVATVRRSGTSTVNTTRYLHKDHLGSVVAITNESGAIIEQLAYDAWGKRRPATNWTTPTPGVFVVAANLRRGFTLHEHIDHVGLIHMGGRVYDPEIGRFLSPDPFVQFPHSTQGFNRYAYVNNNPLSYTDPSGYFLEKLGKKAVSVGIAAVAASHGGWIAVIGGAVAGYLATGSWQGAAVGAMPGLGAMADLNLSSVGMVFGYAGMLRSNSANSQGSISAAGGGRFGDGALGVSSGAIVGARPSVVVATVGGTASPIGVGKFANGASSASFARAQGSVRTLDHRVCSDKGFSCESLPVHERNDVVATATVIIGEIPARDTLLGPFAARFGAFAWIREQPLIIEAQVDLAAIVLVHKVVVTYQSRYFDSFESTFLTGRYEEVLRRGPYTRSATVWETMDPPRYPVRVNWSPLVGGTVNESRIQRIW